MGKYGNLFKPIRVGRLLLKNRIVLAPMSTKFGAEDGLVTERHIQHYLERAQGGVGLIVCESSYVSKEGRTRVGHLGICEDESIKEYRKLTDAVHKEETPICAQLHHAGGSALMRAVAQHPVSCSAIPSYRSDGKQYSFNIPRGLTQPEIKELIKSYSKAAWRARESGFDAIMVHGAHGYLIHQFLSARTNNREDGYGGSEKNRARFLIEILESIRKTLGEKFPIMVRVTGEEFLTEGCRIDFIKKVALWLERAGADEISISAGSREEPERTFPSERFPEGFLSNDSAAIKKILKIPVGVVGRIMSPETAEEIIRKGKADLVYLGRALIADPDFPKKVREGREDEIRPCLACNQCIDHVNADLPLKCSVNPNIGRGQLKLFKRSKKSRKVMVVGGGVAGLEAARLAAMRGHRVALYEKSNKLGGILNKVVLLQHKEQIAKLVKYLYRQMELLGVKIDLNTEVTAEKVRELKPGVLILAVGAEPLRTGLPGSKLPNVYRVEDCLDRSVRLGPSVLIIGGGMVGAEFAILLAEGRKRVMIVEELESIASKAGFITRRELLTRLCQEGVKMLVSIRALAIGHKGVLVERFGKQETIEADTIILATGYQPKKDLVGNLDLKGIEFREIGDCFQPRSIMEAVEDGHRAGLEI